MTNKNKIEELEKKVMQASKKDLNKVMDPLNLALDEMKRTFGFLFKSSNAGNDSYRITIEMEKFEKEWKLISNK